MTTEKTPTTTGASGEPEPRILAAVGAWIAWAIAMVVALAVLSSDAVASDFEYGGHTRTTGGAAVAIPVLYGISLVLGLISVTRPRAGRVISFALLILVFMVSARAALFAMALA